MQVGTQLRQIRLIRKQTLAEVGAATELSISYLSKLERGLTEPRLDELSKLSTHYDVSMSYFLPDSTAQQIAIHKPGFKRFLDQMNGKVDSAMQDLLLRIDAQAVSPAKNVEEWLQYYYVISAITTRSRLTLQE